MTTNTQLTNAGAPLTVNGVEFLASVLTDRDQTELDEFVQNKVLDIAKRNAANLNSVERAEIFQAAIKASLSVCWGSQESLTLIGSKEGSYRLGWQMIKAKHPRVTYSEFRQLCVADSSAHINIDLLYLKLHSFELDSKPEEDDSKKKQTQK